MSKRSMSSSANMREMGGLELDVLFAGNKTAAARVLGLERKTLYRKLARYGVTTEE